MPSELVVRDTGEIVPNRLDIDIAASVSLMRAEVDMQIATARAYPRQVSKAIKRIIELATLDEETAEECCYVLTRRKKGDDDVKPIEGPSIRLAEIAAQSWGNSRVDARVISVNRQEKYIEAEGVFHDLETNVASRAVVRRNIRTSKGALFSDDMITVTGNAACSIAKRNAILAGIPRGVVAPGYRAAREVMVGTVTTLSANRAKVYKAFAAHAVMPAQIHELLGVAGEADVGLDHIALLRATFASIKNGEATVAEVFGKDKDRPEGVVDPLGTSKPVDKPVPNAATSSGDGEIPPVKSEVKAGEADSTGASPAENKTEGWGQTVTSGTVAQPAEKVADGKAEPAAPSGAAEAEAKPVETPATATPVPTTLDEYRAHVLAYVAQATSASALEARWKAKDREPGDKLGDRSLRTKLNIEKELFDELEGVVKAKCAELKGSAA